MDAGKGWCIALQHALGDIAQSDLLGTRAPRARRSSRGKDDISSLA
jgi:hypothetical protein